MMITSFELARTVLARPWSQACEVRLHGVSTVRERAGDGPAGQGRTFAPGIGCCGVCAIQAGQGGAPGLAGMKAAPATELRRLEASLSPLVQWLFPGAGSPRRGVIRGGG
ncbi:hypothetical protein ACFXPA_48120 [Amycolatopsis sp. NPDC059090]|uniref:hypothetical protein n=1 Tax=Amycolatopsis sp. NPDC059090 TaxID=3346723 RepID=UPI00366C1D35